MAALISASFPEYFLTPEELISAQSLTDLQTYNLQNERCKIVSQLLGLVPDPNNYPVFVQQESYLKGQLAMIDYLLELSTTARTQAS